MKYGEKECNLDLMFQSYDMFTDIEATANAIDRYFLHQQQIVGANPLQLTKLE